MELGFVDDCDPALLTAPHFPSKVGGMPAWLDWHGLPAGDRLHCPTCSAPMCFLLQLYTGEAYDDPASFHRAVFVFACKKGKCHAAGTSHGIRVFRSQLPRENEFYSPDPPPESAIVFTPPADLCAVCGCSAPSKCARCPVHYCSRDHQSLHWPKHKVACGSGSAGELVPFVFPELELIIDEEPVAPSQRTEEERLKDFEETVTKLQVDASHEDLDEIESSQQNDKIFLRFRERIAPEPSQVLRCQKNGAPLWIGSHVPGPDAIPMCPYCGAARIFEFQIMPQLLSHLNLSEDGASDTLDFGVVAIYTCQRSCHVPGYAEELAWHNPVDPESLGTDKGDDEDD
eukprot:m.39129 g.39129  ORF g.39129 m.39129 type:complete len:343 (+) comp5546_c0_seq2:107-1135(+)